MSVEVCRITLWGPCASGHYSVALSSMLNKILPKFVLEGPVNSSPLRAAYMHRWTESALVQVMACRLFGAKPLSEPMPAYLWFDHLEQTSVQFESKYKIFHLRKCIWKGRLCFVLFSNGVVLNRQQACIRTDIGFLWSIELFRMSVPQRITAPSLQ